MTNFKLTLGQIIILLFAVAFNNSAQAQCASASNIHSFVHNGVTYEIVKQNENWANAASCAVSRGGFLTEINNAAEQTAIYNELSNNAGITVSFTTAPDGGGGAYVWIGGNDLATEGNWIWDGNNDGIGAQFWQGTASGFPIGGLYNNWGNEPDDFNGQDALALSLNGWPLGVAGQWNDVDETNTLYYVIEYTTLQCSATSSTITEVACNSYTSPSGNNVWTTSNTYTDTIPNAAGCDSVITINLTINSPVTQTDTRTECAPFTWIDGNSYSSNNNSATFTIAGGAANGCDSIVTLDLTVINPATSTDSRTACGSFTWIDGNTYTSSNNTATYVLPGAASNGCDSIVSLDLTILSPSAGTDIQTACGSYTWIDGNTYTASNNTATFTFTAGAANGCDSIVTLDLTILSASAGTDVRTECGSYTWIDGNTYTASNNTATFTFTGGAANGCDSVVTLELTINSVSDLSVSSTGSTITAENANATYQWLDCNADFAVIAGETAQSFTANADGDYAVELTENGCIDTTSCVNVTSIGMFESSLAGDFKIYPNPTKENFFVDLGDNYNTVSVEILDLSGRRIFLEEFTNTNMLELEITQPSGVYLVRVQAGGNLTNIKLLKDQCSYPTA